MDAVPAKETRVGIACPHCRAPGTVRVTGEERVINCKSCGVKFHVNKAGLAMTLAEAESRRRLEPVLHSEDLPWSQIPAWVKFGAPAAIAVLLILAVGRFRGSSEKLPDDLVGRTRVVAESVARGFPDTVKGMCNSGTQKDAVQWLTAVRPGSWNQAITSQIPLQIEVKVIFTTKDRSATLATIVPGAPESESNLTVPDSARKNGSPADAGKAKEPMKAAPPAVRFGELTVLIYWVSVGGDWRIDGTKTLHGLRGVSRD